LRLHLFIAAPQGPVRGGVLCAIGERGRCTAAPRRLSRLPEPLVLFHGLTDSPRTWDLVRPALEAHHEVHVPALLGHHGGPPYRDDPSPRAVADQAERELDAAGLETAHLVGNSLGGAIAILLAARGRARSVVAFAPAGGWSEDDPARKKVVSFYRMTQNMVADSAPRAEEIASTPKGRARALALMVENTDHVPAELVVHQIRAAADCPIALPFIELTATEDYEEPGSIDVPVRIAWGTKDRMLPWPDAARRFYDLVPSAEWVELDGLGHIVQLDDPDRTVRTILEVTAPR